MMIDFDGSVSLKDKRLLPNDSGIYFVIQGDNQILYVGQAKDIKERWKNHHRLWEFKKVDKLKISWIVVPINKLTQIEGHFINKLNPKLNKRPAFPPPKSKKKPKPKSVVFMLRLSTAEYFELSRLADEAGQTMADYIRRKVFTNVQ